MSIIHLPRGAYCALVERDSLWTMETVLRMYGYIEGQHELHRVLYGDEAMYYWYDSERGH